MSTSTPSLLAKQPVETEDEGDFEPAPATIKTSKVGDVWAKIKQRKIVIGVIGAVLVLFVIPKACGGDDSPAAAPSTTAPATTSTTSVVDVYNARGTNPLSGYPPILPSAQWAIGYSFDDQVAFAQELGRIGMSTQDDPCLAFYAITKIDSTGKPIIKLSATWNQTYSGLIFFSCNYPEILKQQLNSTPGPAPTTTAAKAVVGG